MIELKMMRESGRWEVNDGNWTMGKWTMGQWTKMTHSLMRESGEKGDVGQFEQVAVYDIRYITNYTKLYRFVIFEVLPEGPIFHVREQNSFENENVFVFSEKIYIVYFINTNVYFIVY